MTLTTLAEKMIKNQPFTADTGRDYWGYYNRAIRLPLGDVNVKDLDDTRVLNWLKEVIANQPASQVMPITTFMRKLLDMAVRRRHMSTHPLQKRPLREILSELGFERRARSGSRTYFHATFQAPDGGHISFFECATEWMKHSTIDKLLREERVSIMTTVWMPTLGPRVLDSLDRLDILRVTIPMQQTGHLKEAYRALSILRLFFRDMIFAGRITANPARVPTMCLNIPAEVPGMTARDKTNAKQRLFASFKQRS
jgi:hypothetical protein